MKTTIGMLVLGLTVPVWAQSWDVIITNSMTIASTNLSYDGQSVLINAATVTIVGAHAFLNLGFMNGACLKHATGDVDGVQLTISNRLTLATNSWIDVTGCGNKGTYTVDTIGGSHGGRGASYGGASSPCFGDHEEPVLFGGGSKNYRGGGVIRIAAGILQVDGAIVADGANTLGSGLQGGGAGGSIWLTVGTLCGVGQIRANGGYAVWQAGSGGGGRVAIYYADASGFDLTSNVQASGWHASSAAHGGAGTIYLKKEDTGEARLLVNNQPAGLAGAQTELGISQPTLPLEACNAQVVITGAMAVASISGTNATIYQNAALTAPDDHLVVDGWTWVPAYSQTWANVTVTNRGKITHTVTDTNGLRLWVAGTLNVATNSAIDVSGGGTKNTSLNAYVGGSYGGRGGNYGANLSPLCYGDIRYPDVFGGGSYYYAGGGIIRIVAGTLQVDGTVSADGLTTTGGNQGGSAGGSIWLSVGTLRGGGQIRANGGNATWQACGGGGGRIAVYYTDATGFNLADNVRAWGTMDSSYPGGAGTVYLKNMGTETEQLLVKNNRWVTSAMSTELGIDAPALLLEVYNAAAAITGATAVAGISGTNAIVHQNAALTVPDNSLLVNGWTWNPNYYQVWANVTVTNIGKITHPVGNTNGVRLNVTGALTIATNCSLDVSSCGNTNISLNQYPGGSYGGRGGNYGTNESAAVYGSETEPSDFGEGVRGYRGGGKARVEAEVLQLDGSFLSNGQTPVNYYGGAAGGSLWINVGSLRGGGSMSANGATAGYASGGGGGRIAIYCADASSFNLTTARVTVTGGGSSGYGLGSNGTIYIENRARPPAVLSIDPSGATSSAITRILVNLLTPIDPATFTAGDVTLTGPSGPIVPSSVTSSNQHVYAVNLPGALTQEGLYQLTIGPAILSTNGTALDQDRDGAPGEAVDDVFAASFTVDLTPPAAPTVTNYVMAPASNNLRWSSAVLRGTREADTAVWIQGVQRTGTGTGAWTHAQAFTQGVNRLRMYAKDRAGHSSPTSEVIFFVDSIAPAVTAAVPANNAHTGAPPAWVRLTYTEAISGLDTNRSSVSVQRGSVPVAGTWAATTNTLTFTPGAALTGGVYTVAATLIDWLSNTGTFSSAFTVDAAPPAAPGVYPVSTPTFSTNQLVSGTRESYAAVRLNGMLVATSSASIGWSHTVTLTPGVNTLGYSVVDRAGNVSPTTTVEIVYINVAPVRVMAISPSGYSREPVEYIDLTYEYPLNTNTIGLDDFTLTGPQGELPLSQISSLNSQVYRLTPAASLSADGLYRLVMGTNISSITGHAATNNYTGMILVYAAYPAPPVVTNYAMAPVTNELSRTLVVLRGIRETNTAVWIDGVQRVPAGSGAWSYTNLFSQGLTRLALSGTGGGVYSPTNHCIFAVDSLHPAWDVIITNSMTIAATNVIYDGQSVLINAATVTIAGAHVFQNMGLTNGARLTHGPADGTGVYITVSSTLLVATNSSIDASACGARNLSFGNVCGGSYGGRGGQYNGVSPGCFGNFREPALLGGGSYYWEGGGIVRITVDTLWVEGMILADGKGISNGGGAAGGSVWLDVATMLGGGQIRANGGPGSNGSCGGGGGRVAIYYSDTSSFNLANNVQAKGGGGTSGRQSGGAGTVYLKDKGLETEQLSVDNTGMANATVTELGLAEPDMPLLINNAALAVTGSMSVASIAGTNAVVVQNAALTIPEIALGAGSVWTQSASLALSGNSMVMSNWTWTVNYSQTWASVTVTNGGKITHPVGSTNGLLLVVSGPLIVATNSSIDVSGCGVINATVPMYCGGSHGGRGGEYNGVSPSCYGDFKEPDSFGGGCYSYEGGGKAKIVANSLQIDGEILANGKCLGDRGASAGGSIWLDVGTLLGGGRLGATGGKALNASCGGGGGRIAVYYSDASGFNLTNNVQALGGEGNAGRQAGGAGTVYLKDKGAGTELLRVNNAGKAGAAVIELGITAPTVPLVIENAAVTITGSLSVASISGTNASVAQNAAVTSSSIALGNGVVWTQNAYWAVSESNLVVSKWTWSVNYSQTWASVTVTNGGKVTYPAGNTNGLWLNVTGTLAVATNSSIDVTGCGNVESGLFSRVGGSYGGRGGSSGTNLSLVTYGSLMEPVDFGGGSLSYRGGGKVRLTAGVLQLDGMLTANGATPGSAYGAPAGGSVWITTSLLQGGGTIQAKGGQGAINACGGGGGRIAIYYFDSMGFDLTGRVSAAGSAGSGGYESGSNGTVYLEHTKPATPVVSAYRITVSGFSANWSASSGTTNYILDVATDAAFTSYVSGYEHLSLGNVTNVAVTGLDDGQPYYCRVQAINSYGAGDYSEPITVNVPDAFTLLHSFAGGAGDGSTPFYGEPLVAGSTLYGMTSQGGADDVGLVFKMNVDGTGFAVLHEFGTSDGAAPYGSLLLSGSTLYGMTGSGGTNGYGVVFKISVDGTGFAVLHEFSNTDGAAPYGSLAMSGAKLYGTTSEGGSGGYGTLFSMNVDGTGFTVLHDFAYDSGAYPYSTPVVSGATLYGMASEGGSDGYGVVFKMNVDGTGYALLHQFAGGTGDGAYAFGSLTLAASTLYGMTYAGGASNKGVVFSIGTDGTDYALRHEFAGGPADGAAPQGSLTLLNSMVLGMTYDGGANSYGVVYQMNLDGTGFTVLHQFAGTTNNGYQPRGSMTLSGSLLYGMVLMGGAHDKGIIYSYDLGRVTVVLSGRVTDSGTGAGADGIPISFGDRAGMAVTAGGGYYTNAVSVGWSGQATPLQEDFEFTPPSRAYINVTTNQAGQNYTRAVAVPPPPAPESQAATGVTASGFAANWSASAGATNYLLDVSMNSSFTNCVSGYQDLPVGNALTKPVTGLSAGTMYYYRVRAANAGGTSGNSETISVLLVPPAPEAQTSTNASMTSFDAEWLAAAGATNYLLDVSWHEDFVEFAAGYANRSLGDVTWCVVTGLTEEATYYFRVRAQNGSGTSSNSATILVNMAPSPAPDAPEALAATEVDTTSFQANWNGVEGGTNYLLDVSTDESFSQLVNGYANRAVGDAASCLVTGLTPDVVYYYRVRAQDGNGVSASSGTITVPTQPLFWLPMASGMNADVQALAADGSNVYAGGVFTQAGGAGANYAAKWNGTNWAALGSGLNGSVLAVAAGGSKVYAGGTFTQAGGAGANYAAKWDGTNWTALGSGLNGSVSALAVDGSKVYAGGAFTTAGGAGANRIAKWDGTNWTALGSGLNGSVRSVAVYGSKVYAGGEFTTAGGSN
nr:hypothetical protein [Kiritimatiellia bacterium]